MEWKKVSFKLKKTCKKIACYYFKLSRVLFLPFQSKIYLGNNYLSRTNKNLTKINRSFERIFLKELPSASLAALSLKYMCRANTLLHLIKSVGCWCHEWGKVSPHTPSSSSEKSFFIPENVINKRQQCSAKSSQLLYKAVVVY